MAELFSDALAAPPPPPKARFTDILAAGLGAGPDRMGAYQQGLDTGSQYRLRTAQTESALAEAEKRRAEAMRQSMLNDARATAAANPNFVPDMPFYAMLTTSANDLANARLGDQEFGNRSILADLGASPAAQFAAGQGVQGKVLPRMEAIGGETYNLATDPNMQAPQRTAMQDAQLAAERALETQRLRPPAAATSAPKPPSGYRYAADGTLEFIPGGPADPARPQALPAMPAKVRQGMSENSSLLANIDRTIELVRQNPDAFGLKNMAGDLVNQRMDPAGVAPRAAVANIGSAKMHDRSGAAITAKEFPRLTPFIPTATDRSDAIITKLEQMKAEIKAEQDAITSTYSAQPAAPSAAPAAPAAGGAEPAPKTQAEYDALPAGTIYVDTDGKRKRKR